MEAGIIRAMQIVGRGATIPFLITVGDPFELPVGLPRTSLLPQLSGNGLPGDGEAPPRVILMLHLIL